MNNRLTKKRIDQTPLQQLIVRSRLRSGRYGNARYMVIPTKRSLQGEHYFNRYTFKERIGNK
jgi:hypothetical protein